VEQSQVLTSLAQWITFLWQALPKKLRPTLLELLFGCIVSGSGHITQAYLAISPVRFWNTYYKVLQKGVFSWMALVRQWLMLICQTILPEEILFVIDDTLIFRSSRKAPSAALHHDHANRPNRPKYVWGQMLVCLGAVCCVGQRRAALPLMTRMIPCVGNKSKVAAAILLTKILHRWLQARCQVRLLLDAWYMKKSLLNETLRLEMHVIGQVRKDTALFLPPERKPKPCSGRPRKYGLKLNLALAQNLFKLHQASIKAYGKERLYEFHCFAAHVRFLKGRPCKLVWCRFVQDCGKWTKWHLLLSTDLSLDGEYIISRYAHRWLVEACFNELKNTFGLNEAWQQTRQVMARWRCLVCLAYGIPRLLSLVFGHAAGRQLLSIPWRKNRPVTAGWTAKALALIFRNSRVRDFWDRKRQKLVFPETISEQYFRKAA
jgi:hypothetical protein